MTVVPFEKQHMKWLRQQPGHLHLLSLPEGEIEKLGKSAYAYSILADDGAVLLCGGVALYWRGRGEAWAVVNRNRKGDFVGVHRRAKKFLDLCPVRRIEAAVEVSFEAGHRWVKALGFQEEASCLKAYLPGGQDCTLYARVANG